MEEDRLKIRERERKETIFPKRMVMVHTCALMPAALKF